MVLQGRPLALLLMSSFASCWQLGVAPRSYRAPRAPSARPAETIYGNAQPAHSGLQNLGGMCALYTSRDGLMASCMPEVC